MPPAASPTDYDFSNPNGGVWNEQKLSRGQWMLADEEKKPFAPWADPDAPADCSNHDQPETCDNCEHDARWKWSYKPNYRDGHTALMAEIDPKAIAPCFLQLPDDPYAYVDGDKVIDPETGEPHPAWVALLNHLGATYTDISQSGSGSHAEYLGELPEGVKEAGWQLDDEPWGANEEPPSIEIYDGKRVLVATGKLVDGAPEEIREWDDDVIDALMEANDQYSSPATSEDLDLSDYTPTATDSDETTSDVRDIYKAIDQLDARDVAERTIVYRWNDSASTSGGRRAFYPVWGKQSNGTANIVDEKIWQDTGDAKGWGGPATMAAIDAGLVTHRNISPTDVDGRTWWEAVDHLRELGYPIPVYQPGEAVVEDNYIAVMPENSAYNRLSEGWDWVHASENEFGGSALDDARDKTQEALETCFEGYQNKIVHALPSTGKTTGSVRACAETDVPVTFLTGRGVDEQYEKLRSTCDEYGVTHYTLPAFDRDCPCMRGEHGDAVYENCEKPYSSGATPKEIHAKYETWYGHEIPCKQGQECPYVAKWDFEADDYDMLIGHYNHAKVQKTIISRAVAIDEFDDAYVDQFESGHQQAMSSWLQNEDAIPIDDHAELLEVRNGGTPEAERKRAEALAYFSDGVDRAPDEAFGFNGHAKAPMMVFTMLAAAKNPVGDTYERARFPDDKRIGVYNRETGDVTVVNPPDWQYSRSVTALDGTPTKEMWQDVLGLYLRHERVLTPDERKEYIAEGMNLNIVQTTDAVKPYSSGNYVNIQQDEALMRYIHDQYGEFGLISSKSAVEQYDEAGLLWMTEGERYYGNLLGSNQFADTRVGCVIGSTNFGDDFVKLWGAIHGEAVEPERADGKQKGTDLTYGVYGDKVLQHMREHQTLQALMRFARDGRGGVVYVHTNTIPDWVPHEVGSMIRAHSPGEEEVIDAFDEIDTEQFTTADVAEVVTNIERRSVLRILKRFQKRGHLHATKEGGKFVWGDDGLHRLNDAGEVLEEVEIGDLTIEEASDISRNSTFMLSVGTSHLNDGLEQPQGGSTDEVSETNPKTANDPPPD